MLLRSIDCRHGTGKLYDFGFDDFFMFVVLKPAVLLNMVTGWLAKRDILTQVTRINYFFSFFIPFPRIWMRIEYTKIVYTDHWYKPYLSLLIIRGTIRDTLWPTVTLAVQRSMFPNNSDKNSKNSFRAFAVLPYLTKASHISAPFITTFFYLSI